MASGTEVKSGYLYTGLKTLRTGKSWSKKKWYVLLSSDKGGILLQHDSHEKLSKNPKITNLNQIEKVEKFKEQDCSFQVVSKKDKHIFKCETIEDETSWIDAFQSLIIEHEHIPKMRTLVIDPSELVIEPNELYESMDTTPKFVVSVVDNAEATKCKLSSRELYHLKVEKDFLSLHDIKTGALLYDWYYHNIRNFGMTKEYFQISAGRRCSTGEGNFMIVTSQIHQIFELINSNKSKHQNSSNESLNTSSPRQATPPAKMPSPRQRRSTADVINRNSSANSPTSTPKFAQRISPNIDPTFKQNLGTILAHQTSTEDQKLILKGSTENAVVGEIVKRQLSKKSSKEQLKSEERERKEREKKEKEERKERERQEKLEQKEAKRREKELKFKGKVKKQDSKEIPMPLPVIENDYDDPSSCYDEVQDDFRKKSIRAVVAPTRPVSAEEEEDYYAEASDTVRTPLPEKLETYAYAEVERKDAWRNFGRENDVVHVEDYENIKAAAAFKNNGTDDSLIPKDTEEDSYDSFTGPEPPLVVLDPDHVYGVATGKVVVPSSHIPSSDYEEASTVEVVSLSDFKEPKQ